MAKTYKNKIWLGINKNGFMILHSVEPTRNVKTGKWESKYPYVNSNVYKTMSDMVKQTKMTWESPAEYFEISF